MEKIEYESEYIIKNLISMHSMLNNGCGRKVKDAISNALFAAIDWYHSECSDNDFEQHIITNDWVYCYTKDPIEQLEKINNVILSTSINSSSFNTNYDLFESKKYKYLYRLHVKSNCFGIVLNSFNNRETNDEINALRGKEKITRKDFDRLFDLRGYVYNANIHDNEEEVLVRLKDIDNYEKL